MKYVQLNKDNITELIRILSDINVMLDKEGHVDQTDFLSQLVDKIRITGGDFIHELDSAKFWGGSGSILDIEFRNSIDKSEFARLLKELLNFLNKENIMGKRARSAYSLLV